MWHDNETTASHLHVHLTSLGHTINLWTILCCRTSLGWTFRESAYCQLIHDVNKQKQLEFARDHKSNNFANVNLTDECSVQLESHRWRCCCKQGEPAKNKPRYSPTWKFVVLWSEDIISLSRAKHPVKVHVWAGISMGGRTGICIFEGT